MTGMGNRGSRNNRNQGKANGTQRNSHRNPGLKAVRIDWENVTFDQETELEDEAEENLTALTRSKGLKLITSGETGSVPPKGRRKSARPPHLSNRAEVDFIENELEGSSGFELGEVWADRYSSLGGRLTAMELERQRLARLEEQEIKAVPDEAVPVLSEEEPEKTPEAEEDSASGSLAAEEKSTEAAPEAVEDSTTEVLAAEGESTEKAPEAEEDSTTEVPAAEKESTEKAPAAEEESTAEDTSAEEAVPAAESTAEADSQEENLSDSEEPEEKIQPAREETVSTEAPLKEEAMEEEAAGKPEEAAEVGEKNIILTEENGEEPRQTRTGEDTEPESGLSEVQEAEDQAHEPEEANASLKEEYEADASKDEQKDGSLEEEAGRASVSTDRRRKSARPQQYSYVQIPEEDYLLPDETGEPKKARKNLAAMLAAVAATLFIAFYGGMSYYYSSHFFHGTTINGLDCSEKTAYEAEQMLADSLKDYAIEVSSRDNSAQRIYGSDIGYRYLSDGEVLDLVKKQKPYAWISGFVTKRSYTAAKNVTFDKTLLQTQLKALDCAQDENQVEPQNAFVTMKGNEFEIVPETQGSELKVKEAYRVLDEAVSSGRETVDFTSEPEVYVEAELTHDSPAILSMLDAYNNYARASITYTFGNERETLNGDILKTWLEFDDNGKLLTDSSLFMAHIQDYVADLAARHDTVGTSRPFTTYDGRTVYVYSYAYGWMIDQEAECAQLQQDITNGAAVSREPVYAMTAASYGENDLGDTYIEVDLSDQHMYYYRGGYIIFDSDIVSGDITVPGRATPEGIYTLYFKQSPAVLKGNIVESTGLPEYETQVTYWMPFNGGIGFHDAEWQPYFGGDRYVGGGSHGCINLPYYAAAELYNIIEYDVPIVCFY